MADDEAKTKLSGRLLGLKFMQRANEKKERERATAEAVQQPPPADLPSDEWVGASGTQPRCVVIREDDPKPAVAGRFSFRAADVEQLADIGAAAGGSVRREAGAPSFAPPAQVAAPPPPQQQPQPQRQKTPEGERKAAKKRQRAEGAVADGGFRKPPVGGGSFK